MIKRICNCIVHCIDVIGSILLFQIIFYVTVTMDGTAHLYNETYEPAYDDMNSPESQEFSEKFCSSVSTFKTSLEDVLFHSSFYITFLDLESQMLHRDFKS